MDKEQLMDNYLHGTDIWLYQRRDMFRANTDTFLLGSYLKVNSDETILDIGTNNGALLLYASLNKPKLLCGIDIFEQALELATMNLERNGIDNYKLIKSDVKDFYHRPFDVIVSNPPYFVPTECSYKNEYMAKARNEASLMFADLCQAINRLLKDDGRFYCIYPYERLAYIKNILSLNNLYIKQLQAVKDNINSKANTVLLTIVKYETATEVLDDLILKR